MLLTSLVSFFLASIVVSANTDGVKACGPTCCGCDLSQGKKKVEVLNGMFLDDLKSDPQDLAGALNMFGPGASMFIVGENCDSRACCQELYTPTNGLNWLDGRTITTVDEEFSMLVNGTIISDYTLFSSKQNVSTIAYTWKMWWNPDQYCNYKIQYVEALSYNCPYGNPPTPFQQCDTCIE